MGKIGLIFFNAETTNITMMPEFSQNECNLEEVILQLKELILKIEKKIKKKEK